MIEKQAEVGDTFTIVNFPQKFMRLLNLIVVIVFTGVMMEVNGIITYLKKSLSLDKPTVLEF